MRTMPSQSSEGQVERNNYAAPLGTRSGSIKVLLAEDLDLLRSALVSLLSEEEDIEVVAALKCNDKVTQVAMRLRPDVVVVDVDLPCTNGLSTVRELRRRLPETQIVALAAAKPAGLVQRLLAADVLGAVDKGAPAARLLEAIRGAAKGELVVDVNLAVAALAVEPNPLTPRELEVLRLAAEGASGPEIAEQLHLSPGTVRNYLSKVINKTTARTRVDAVRIAREAGWI
ncbi:MAG TPA: response regulator transcription factor [Actinophytocola sp.]|uniref:response regulator transcription factor n=1 Tax=Actinophytocola sp. TaxID=1872138 RepID=UPI002DFB590C|nr:response regulator transcription factor [Actinophytocola sp.]